MELLVRLVREGFYHYDPATPGPTLYYLPPSSPGFRFLLVSPRKH